MIPSEAKEREIRKYRRLESQHLRLRRTKIRLSDFRTVKVIGKGAFGEVASVMASLYLLLILFSGSAGAEGGHRQSIRYEDSSESRDVEARPGTYSPAWDMLILIWIRSLPIYARSVIS